MNLQLAIGSIEFSQRIYLILFSVVHFHVIHIFFIFDSPQADLGLHRLSLQDLRKLDAEMYQEKCSVCMSSFPKVCKVKVKYLNKQKM